MEVMKMNMMKKIAALMMVVMAVAFCTAPTVAFADDASVETQVETEESTA